MKSVLVAMSGGVDSAAACAVLQAQGYRVGGGTMVLRPGGEPEAEDARRAAGQMGVPFHRMELQAAFRRQVIEPFMQVYQSGGTPNPCVICNRVMKFGLFLDRALELGYDQIATGHYAKVVWSEATGRWLLLRPREAARDQTYMLYGLTQRQLSHTLFPLGDLTKDEARALAASRGLDVASKRDSQDICFVPDGDYMAYLVAQGMTPQPGHFLGEDGTDYGPHRGMEAYTIGQRRGLDLSCGKRVYVVGKRGGDVLIGENAALFSRRVPVGDVNWISVPSLAAPMRVQARLRHTTRLDWAELRPGTSPDTAALYFDEPQRAVTPGQAAVFYDGDVVVGGGTILPQDEN